MRKHEASGSIGRRAAPGFTLVEVMAAAAIFGILLAIAIPPLYRSMDSMHSRQDAEALAGRLRLARSQSLSAVSDITVYFNLAAANTYSVHLDNGGGSGLPGDPDFDPADKNDGEMDASERVSPPLGLGERMVFGYVPGGQNSAGEFIDEAISFDGSPPRVTFHADGTADADGWVVVMPREDFGVQQPGRDYLVELRASTGEVRVVRVQH